MKSGGALTGSIVMEETKKSHFLIQSLNGMAYGLFATLIIATIISTIGGFFKGIDPVYETFSDVAACLRCLTGAGIGVGVALMLKMDALKTIVVASVGELAAYLSMNITKDGPTYGNAFKIGDPLTIYIVVIATILLMKLVLRKKTPVDILIVPFFGIAVGTIVALLIRFPLIYVTFGIQYVIDVATTYQPFLMGVIIAALMGMALTAPISSAAIGAIVFTGEGVGLEIASGAALIGCCTQMVGFAVQSIHDNKAGMVLSIFFGTSMLQFKNILKKPVIWLPTILTSMILGPISTCLIKVKCMGSSAGMGTAGLVGQIGTIASMGNQPTTYLIIVFFEILAPLVLVFALDWVFRKFKWIQKGDLEV